VVVRVDAYLARLGRRTFTLDEDSVRHPELLEVVSIEPEKIKLSLRGVSEPMTPAP
jgi:hypothetical protein